MAKDYISIQITRILTHNIYITSILSKIDIKTMIQQFYLHCLKKKKYIQSISEKDEIRHVTKDHQGQTEALSKVPEQ